jgi:hypothetical protein
MLTLFVGNFLVRNFSIMHVHVKNNDKCQYMLMILRLTIKSQSFTIQSMFDI